MTVNIYDTANQLERELRQTEQFTALVAAFKAIEGDAKSKEEFDAFRALTEKFQLMQMSGQEPTEADIKEAEEVSKKAQDNALILDLMKKEQAMQAFMGELNDIITKPLAELYQVQK